MSPDCPLCGSALGPLAIEVMQRWSALTHPRSAVTPDFARGYSAGFTAAATAEPTAPRDPIEAPALNTPDDTAIVLLEDYAGRMPLDVYEDLHADIAQLVTDEREWVAAARDEGRQEAVEAAQGAAPRAEGLDHDPVPVCDRCHELIVMDDEGDWLHADEVKP